VFVLLVTPILDISIPIAAHYAGILDLPMQEPRVRWVLIISFIPSIALFILPCLLEEIGWRGFLLPKFMSLGQLPALFLSGALWGFWHISSKLINIHNGYPCVSFLYAFLYTLVFFPFFNTLFGVLVGWTRLKSGSIWPAVIMHAAYDCTETVLPIFFAHGFPRDEHLLNSPLLSADPLHTSIIGWPGWILLSVVIAIMVVCKQLPVKDPL
jgi:membrane protease YdiL (CAAX protease family)